VARTPSGRTKRVSLKGKGADIFFGDYAPPGPDDGPTPPSSTDATDRPTGSTVAGAASSDTITPLAAPTSTQASTLASKNESKQASILPSQQTSRRASKQEGVHAESASADATINADVSDATTAGTPTGRPSGPAGRPRPGTRRQIDGGTTPGREKAEPAVPAEITPEVWASLETPATITNSFRYTDEELSALADALYAISKQQKTRLTKQDVARLGLNVVLDDYRRRGPSSLLGQLAGRRRPRRAGGG
jgi:hypothetical protein